jgi:Zn-dependent alcohol dehydrogenase
MAKDVRGVIARKAKAPVEVVEINVPDPGPGKCS